MERFGLRLRGLRIDRRWGRADERASVDREREEERRALAGDPLALDPYLPPVALDDFLHHGQADPGSRVLFAAVEALEDHEDPLVILRQDPDPVVPDRKEPVASLPLGLDPDVRGLLAVELDRVPD